MKTFRSLLSCGLMVAFVLSIGLRTPNAQAGNFPTLVDLQTESSVAQSPIVVAAINDVAKAKQAKKEAKRAVKAAKKAFNEALKAFRDRKISSEELLAKRQALDDANKALAAANQTLKDQKNGGSKHSPSA